MSSTPAGSRTVWFITAVLCSATLFLHPSRGGETSVRGSASVKRPWNWLPRRCFYRVMCVAGTPVPNESPQRELSEKWHSHRITEKSSINSTSLLNEKIKLLPQMYNQEEEDYDLHWESHNAFDLSLVQSDLQPSADTIINPRSLSKHCRRGLSHVCRSSHWKPSWMSNQNYRKENRLFFCTSVDSILHRIIIRESLWTSRKSLEMIILCLCSSNEPYPSMTRSSEVTAEIKTRLNQLYTSSALCLASNGAETEDDNICQSINYFQ